MEKNYTMNKNISKDLQITIRIDNTNNTYEMDYTVLGRTFTRIFKGETNASQKILQTTIDYKWLKELLIEPEFNTIEDGNMARQEQFNKSIKLKNRPEGLNYNKEVK